MSKVLNSIGRKIFFIALFAVLAVSLLVFVSLSFFGKVDQIGKIEQIAYVYEGMIKDVSIAFEKYTISRDKQTYVELTKMLSVLTVMDGRTPILHKLLKETNSVAKSMEIYNKTPGEKISGTRDLAMGLNNIMGSPLALKLVNITSEANDITTTLQNLAKQFNEQKDIEVQKQIIAKFKAEENKIPGMLKSFHAIMGELAGYFLNKINMLFSIIGMVFVVLISLIAFLITRSITGPLKQAVNFLKIVSDGNFKETLDIKSSDEIGIMVNSMNTMSKNLRGMVKEIIAGIDQLNISATDLTSLSDQVSDTALDNAEKANSVATATEEMSSNMNAVANNMETSSQNTNSVVVAIEELTNTINEIAKNTGHAKNITDKAVERSSSATKQMSKLGKVANTIGKVTETISDISEQTNLLSLNATIEAARAGEAGKGFAVVASEIKDLANQTATSTQDIKKQIDEIQASTKVSVEEIEQISSVIREISQIVTTIATAIEEQSIATSEIAQNVTMVSDGIVEVNDNVSQSSVVATEITQSISEVHNSTDSMKKNSSLVKESAIGLSDLAKTLNEMMERFTV